MKTQSKEVSQNDIDSISSSSLDEGLQTFQIPSKSLNNTLPKLQHKNYNQQPPKTLRKQFTTPLTDYERYLSNYKLILGFTTAPCSFLSISVTYANLLRKIPSLATKITNSHFQSLQKLQLPEEVQIASDQGDLLTFLQICTELTYQRGSATTTHLMFTRQQNCTNFVLALNSALFRSDFSLKIPVLFAQMLKNQQIEFEIVKNSLALPPQPSLTSRRQNLQKLKTMNLTFHSILALPKIQIDVPLVQTNQAQPRLQRAVIPAEISKQLLNFCDVNNISLQILLQAANFMSKECEFQADFEENIVFYTKYQFLPILTHCNLTRLRANFISTLQKLTIELKNCAFLDEETILGDGFKPEKIGNDITFELGEFDSCAEIFDFVVLNGQQKQLRGDAIVLNFFIRNGEINLNWGYSPEILPELQQKILSRFQTILATLADQLTSEAPIDMGDSLKKYFNV